MSWTCRQVIGLLSVLVGVWSFGTQAQTEEKKNVVRYVFKPSIDYYYSGSGFFGNSLVYERAMGGNFSAHGGIGLTWLGTGPFGGYAPSVQLGGRYFFAGTAPNGWWVGPDAYLIFGLPNRELVYNQERLTLSGLIGYSHTFSNGFSLLGAIGPSWASGETDLGYSGNFGIGYAF